ncbi:MAG TPA: ABC transporter ATP-binding protein [Thermomicrobiales bacterium]|jgi:peptide/nickel transport system ATP-binding protein|nr:ABC transporter ATP-binding protein [Thermomicrobiales bacterium]
MTTLLEARHVTKVFGGGVLSSGKTVALDDFSLKIDTDPPIIMAVVGESGSGKTTLARLLLGATEPTSGQILYRGKNLQTLSRQEQRAFQRDVQVIFQDPYEVYNPFYKVDHVLYTPVMKFGLASSKSQARELIVSALSAVGLRPEETLGRYPHQLSGGQRQRIMVARALLVRPRLIIADEPVSMVDASLRATILDNLRSLTTDYGVSVIYITHDLITAYQISHDIVVLYRGSVTEAGNAEPIVQAPEHPYTQLLVGSIPQPDPDRAWAPEQGPSALGRQAAANQGCKFATRCPYAFEPCLAQHPPLYQTAGDRVAACYRYQDAPVLPSEDLDDVFVKPMVSEGAAAD